ncbi:hypothetical protein [Phytophthora cinnamomi ormycovirus 11-3]|uniref:Uncharacterized protein n=1 Tax=Phytophthora cinnamomi ormycovirus 11-3 TaxID=3239320 RepID=A0AB39J9I7_9VIRU
MVLEQNRGTIECKEGPKRSFLDMASARQQRALAYKPLLMVSYNDTMKDGKLTERDLNALSETLSYVEDRELVSQLLDDKPVLAPQALYAWAIANASIAFPYMTLKEASQKVTTNLEVTPSWGHVKDGIIQMPLPNEDREIWYMISALTIKLLKVKVEYLSKDPIDSPELGNDEIARNATIHVILRRIVELMKSPLSATIRSGSLSEQDMVRNAVDFVVLDHMYRNSDDWKSLRVSDSAVKSGRRSVSTPVTEGKGSRKRISYTSTFVGYRVSELLLKYVTTSLSKSAESDAFVHLILSLIIKTIPDSVPTKYEIPKNFFEAPSATVRKCLRQGPKITTKKGLRDNLYAPFSFVKSSECKSMPLDIRKSATDLSTEIITSLDQINKLDASIASQNIEGYRRYLDFSYTLSDIARDKWRKHMSTPDYSQLRKLLESVKTLDEDNKENLLFHSEDIEEAKVQSRKLDWTVVPQNNAEIDAIKHEIDEAMNKRKRISS